MNPSQASTSTRLRVGIFTAMGLLLVAAVTVFVNDRPFWWRKCELVHINVEDATGLKTKSPIRSLGIDIGYLQSFELTETFVKLDICITAPVDVLPQTRAYLRPDGFLGDKFVELKPVKYRGATLPPQGRVPNSVSEPAVDQTPGDGPQLPKPEEMSGMDSGRFLRGLKSLVTLPEAYAQEERKQIPIGEKSQDIQHLVEQVDSLVGEMTNLTENLKETLNPQDLKTTIQRLNRTLENASKTLAPEGGLNTTAQRSLAKLEDAIEQLRDIVGKVNRGEGSVGVLLNDPSFAEEIRGALKDVRALIGKVDDFRFVVDLSAAQIVPMEGARGAAALTVWPDKTRYYRAGISMDPRGSRRVTTTTLVSGEVTTVIERTDVAATGLLITAQFGKLVGGRLDLAAGMLFGDGAVSAGVRLGPSGKEELFQLRGDAYSRGKGTSLDIRVTGTVQPFVASQQLWSSVYLTGGVEGFQKTSTGEIPWFVGAGLTFDDEEIKLLFALQ